MSAALALCALLAVAPGAEPNLAGTRVVLLVEDEANRAAPSVREADAALSGAGARVSVQSVPEASRALRSIGPGSDDDALWLAVGKGAAPALAAATPRKRAALLVRHGEAAGLPAVVVDVPLDAQLGWLASAFPGRSRVLVPRRPGSRVDGSLLAAAAAHGLRLELVDVERPGETVPALQAALRRGSAPALVFLVPDSTALTADTLAPLAQMALEARAPLVGFSPYFLRIGALAAVASDVGPAARQAAALALAGQPMEEAPRAARLLVDGRLAERLGVAVRESPGVEVRR